ADPDRQAVQVAQLQRAERHGEDQDDRDRQQQREADRGSAVLGRRLVRQGHGGHPLVAGDQGPEQRLRLYQPGGAREQRHHRQRPYHRAARSARPDRSLVRQSAEQHGEDEQRRDHQPDRRYQRDRGRAEQARHLHGVPLELGEHQRAYGDEQPRRERQQQQFAPPAQRPQPADAECGDRGQADPDQGGDQ